MKSVSLTKKNYIHFIVFFAYLLLLIAVDQITKYMAVFSLKGKSSFCFINRIISFDYLENNGAAWSIMSGKTWFLSIITILVIILLCSLCIRIETRIKIKSLKFKLLQFVLFTLIAGAIGNLIDRIRLKYVIDFIKLEFISFPTFNVADCYVTVSAIALIVMMVFFISEKEINKIIGKLE